METKVLPATISGHRTSAYLPIHSSTHPPAQNMSVLDLSQRVDMEDLQTIVDLLGVSR